MAAKNPHTVKDFTGIILDNITDGVFTIDGDKRITSFNHAAERITGVPKSKAIGQFCHDVLRANVCETDCALYQTMEDGIPLVSKKLSIINSDGLQIPISISTAQLRDPNGKIIGGVETFRDQSAVQELRKRLEESYSFADIISKNNTMVRLFSILPQIAESDSTVLIEGESGTGKELFARVIHSMSKRKAKKLIAVNCGALPDSLIESELFGYKAGAFTDAKKDKKGRFAQAEKSTIFLDEIGDVSPAFQVRLLRFLQDRVYEPLGSTESVKANVRVIAATNKNLHQLVEQGNFRDDLFYRINIIKITIPPLRERRGDIPTLVKHFINKFNLILEKNVESVSPRVMEILMTHNFPGNVRELENVIERSMVLCRSIIIDIEHLPPELTGLSHAHSPSTRFTYEDSEKNKILQVLKKTHWNRLAAAKELGIHKTTLFRKIKRLKIDLPKVDGRNLSKK